jgi:thiol-disulfide isomerase/thioredoxin
MCTLRWALAVVAMAGVVAACGGSHGSASGTVQVIPAGDRVPAPPLEGVALNGGVINIRDFAGDVVVLNFWASWCAPCRDEQPTLNQVYAAQHPNGVEFVGVNIQDNNAAARSFVRNHDVRYPSIVDEPDASAVQFEPRLPATPPITVIVDRQGRVAARILGGVRGILAALVAQLVAERAS